MDVGVRQDIGLQARVLEYGKRLGQSLRTGAWREQLAAVPGHGQVGVVRPFAHQLEQCQDTRPGREALAHGTTLGGVAFKLLEQPVQPVAAVVQRVLARQQFPGLREQDDDEAHGYTAPGAVDLGRCRTIVGRCQVGEVIAVTADQDLHGLAHAFAEHFGEFGLALARVADGLQQRRGRIGSLGRPQLGVEQCSQRTKLLREFAFLEPEVDVPLAPRLEVQSGEQQAPVATIGEQSEMFVSSTQVTDRLAHEPPAAAEAKSFAVVDEDGQPGAADAFPQVAGLDGLPGGRAPTLTGRHAAAAQPSARGRVEAADLFEYEGDERRAVRVVLGERSGSKAQPLGGVVVERRRREAGHVLQAAQVEQ